MLYILDHVCTGQVDIAPAQRSQAPNTFNNCTNMGLRISFKYRKSDGVTARSPDRSDQIYQTPDIKDSGTDPSSRTVAEQIQ